MKYLLFSFIFFGDVQADNSFAKDKVEIDYPIEKDEDKKIRKNRKKIAKLSEREKKKYMKERKKNVKKNSSRFHPGSYKSKKNYNI
jgi:hypothetical protein